MSSSGDLTTLPKGSIAQEVMSAEEGSHAVRRSQEPGERLLQSAPQCLSAAWVWSSSLAFETICLENIQSMIGSIFIIMIFYAIAFSDEVLK